MWRSVSVSQWDCVCHVKPFHFSNDKSGQVPRLEFCTAFVGRGFDCQHGSQLSWIKLSWFSSYPPDRWDTCTAPFFHMEGIWSKLGNAGVRLNFTFDLCKWPGNFLSRSSQHGNSPHGISPGRDSPPCHFHAEKSHVRLYVKCPLFCPILTKIETCRTAKKAPHFATTKINWLTLFKEIISVCSENHTKPMNTKWRVIDCWSRWDMYSYHWALKG
jgi:hypothetical protein